MSIKEHRKKTEIIKNSRLKTNNSPKGLSVIIPIHNGGDYIERLLENLLDQKYYDAKFEIIIVFNGKFHKELSFIYDTDKYFNHLDIVLLINDKKGAGAARNLGIKFSKYSHVTFLDVDDYLSDNFIQKNYDYLSDNNIVFSQIFDVINNKIIPDNVLNKELIKSVSKEKISYKDIHKILTITACKTIPKQFFSSNEFTEHLKSGEDTVFFTEMLVNVRPGIKIIPLEEEVIYYREYREESVSRRSGSYDFLINQRVEILKILEPLISNIRNLEIKKIIRAKYNAQIVFMNKYLTTFPENHMNVIKKLESYNFKYFNYTILNKGLANTLIISYCFAPFSDTSASIVMKRILKSKNVVDVVSNSMGLIRSKDISLKKVIRPYISENKVSSSRVSFSNFYYLSKFIDDTFEFYSKNEGRYQNIYSRAMFPISHFPPLFIKEINPKINWIAEFSDPLLVDIESNKRTSTIDNSALMKYLKSGVLGEFTKYVDDNLFNLMEIIPFALADELIFTNKNQLDFMTSRFSSDLKTFIESKSKIEEHPTLDKKYYELVQSNYSLDKEYINVGYFGNFYSRRDVDELIQVKEKLEKGSCYYFKFHVFTNIKNLNEKQYNTLHNNDVTAHKILPYFEFLNLSTKLDVLLVFDSSTIGIKSINPYLPSKLSDYLGSETTILALVEQKSILSEKEYESLYKIDINNIIDSDFELSSFEDNITKKKQNYIRKDKQALEYYTDDYTLSIDNSLELTKVEHTFNVIPKNVPISFENNYVVKIRNTGKRNLKLLIKSVYKKSNVIFVNVNKNSSKTEKISIDKFLNSKEFEVQPNNVVSFEIEYLKEYNKQSFLNAGRLLFEIRY